MGRLAKGKKWKGGKCEWARRGGIGYEGMEGGWRRESSTGMRRGRSRRIEGTWKRVGKDSESGGGTSEGGLQRWWGCEEE